MNVENMNEVKTIDAELNQIWDYLSRSNAEKSTFRKLIYNKIKLLHNMSLDKEYQSTIEHFIVNYKKIDSEKIDDLIRYYFYMHAQIKLILLTNNLDDESYNMILNIISNIKINDDKNIKYDIIKNQIIKNIEIVSKIIDDVNLSEKIYEILLLNYYYSLDEIKLPIKSRCEKSNV